MRRYGSAAQANEIAIAFGVIGPRWRERLGHVEFLCGVDPAWAGLHATGKTLDGRSYSDTAHCVYPWHTGDRSTTIALPVFEPYPVVIHELGHAVHQRYAFDHEAVPVCEYAQRDSMEAFACSFHAHFMWVYDQDAYHRDEATRSLFAGLAA